MFPAFPPKAGIAQCSRDVRFNSKIALTASKSDFRFTLEGGLYSDIAPCRKSAKLRSPSDRREVGFAPQRTDIPANGRLAPILLQKSTIDQPEKSRQS
jgi:hypothetical protein